MEEEIYGYFSFSFCLAEDLFSRIVSTKKHKTLNLLDNNLDYMSHEIF